MKLGRGSATFTLAERGRLSWLVPGAGATAATGSPTSGLKVTESKKSTPTASVSVRALSNETPATWRIRFGSSRSAPRNRGAVH